MLPSRFFLLASASVVALAASTLLTECSSTSTPTSAALVAPDTQPTVAVPPQTGPQAMVLGDFNARSVTYQGKTYLFQVFLPRTYTPAKSWSIIMALHGSSTRGSDNTAQLKESLANYLRAQASVFPTVVIFPQAPVLTRQSDFMPIAFAILDQEMKELNGDPARVYLMGYSYGGYLAFDMGFTAPTRFAAIVTIGALFDRLVVPNYSSMTKSDINTAFAQQLRGIPIWAFQGALDPFTPVADARLVIDALRAAGDNVTYTEVPNGGHDVVGTLWNPQFFSWLYAQHR